MKTNFYSLAALGAFAGAANALTMQTRLTTSTTQAGALPSLQANADEVTISGMSAGAHNSCHMMILLSDTIKGAGCTKGGAFMSEYAEFRRPETTRESLSAEALDMIAELEADGKIDPTSNFVDQSDPRAVILLSADDDGSVPDKNVWGIFDIYEGLGMIGTDGADGQNLKHVQTGSTGHRFEDTYPQTMLSFLYDTLGYDEIQPSVDSASLGTYAEFD